MSKADDAHTKRHTTTKARAKRSTIPRQKADRRSASPKSWVGNYLTDVTETGDYFKDCEAGMRLAFNLMHARRGEAVEMPLASIVKGVMTPVRTYRTA